MTSAKEGSIPIIPLFIGLNLPVLCFSLRLSLDRPTSILSLSAAIVPVAERPGMSSVHERNQMLKKKAKEPERTWVRGKEKKEKGVLFERWDREKSHPNFPPLHPLATKIENAGAGKKIR
jgi:hypothetical protein